MIKLYADGADMNGIIEASKDPMISGFTTNPTLMRQAGVTNYEEFARTVIDYLAKNRPETNISLEVFADEPSEIIRQARQIDAWGDEYGYDVYVKIPVMHTNGESTGPIIELLSNEGIKLNVTAVFSTIQVEDVLFALNNTTPAILSVFAGRLTDIGFNAQRIIRNGLFIRNGLYDRNTNDKHNVKFLWASSREAYNYIQAAECGCDIITMTPDLIKKVKGFHSKTPDQFSQETCQMFYDDAIKSGFKI